MNRWIAWMAAFLMILFSGTVMAETASARLEVKSGGRSITYKLVGPYSHKNLSVYLIQGEDQVSDKKLISLEGAMEKGLVRVDETGSVNRLSADNRSSEFHVFIQGGDIVKGGKQDRTIGKDVVLAPKSGKVALDSFCVEQGRWQSRGSEPVTQFSSAKKQLSSKELKLAAKRAGSQQEVWRAVEAEQARLGGKVGKSVKNETSASSLQLTLEDKEVENKVADYVTQLRPSLTGSAEMVGVAYVINGRFNSADIYGTRTLFNELREKSLEAAACEAVSLFEVSTTFTEPAIQTVGDQIINGLAAPGHSAKSGGDFRFVSRDSKDTVVYETLDSRERMIHFNVIRK